MEPNKLDSLKELIAYLKENDVAEFDLDREDVKIRLKFASAVVPPAPPAASLDLAAMARLLAMNAPAAVAQPAHSSPAAPPPPTAPAAATPAEEQLHIVKSPIVGTFYASPAPGSPAFVAIGDRVAHSQIICIVEAMKLMNEIESDAAGEIVKCLVTNGQPVEYGQPLFAIRTV
jgi:acetyl-CoA carboxylase biotin carboxyl carrier protein